MKEWTKIMFLLALAMTMVLSAGALMVACGDDDDDDDTAGDDTAGDDDTGDDDSGDDDTGSDDDTGADDDTGGLPETCEDIYSYWYNTCEYGFTDGDGNLIPLEDVVYGCETGGTDFDLGGELAGCIYGNYPDCDAILECVNSVLGG